MTLSHDPLDRMSQRTRDRREFWTECVVPMVNGLESLVWRLAIRGLWIIAIFRCLFP